MDNTANLPNNEDSRGRWALDMEIRKDFECIRDLLTRLLEYSEQFHELNKGDWSHLKGKEDYQEIYKLGYVIFRRIEPIYKIGCGFANSMSEMLRIFNSVSDYPYFSLYVDDLEKLLNEGWLSDRPIIDEIVARVGYIIEKYGITPAFLELYSTDNWRSAPGTLDKMVAHVEDIIEKCGFATIYLEQHLNKNWRSDPKILDKIIYSVIDFIKMQAKDPDKFSHLSDEDYLPVPKPLDKILPYVKDCIKKHDINLYSINEMVIIFEKQLVMKDGIIGWIQAAKETDLYKAGAGLPIPTKPSMNVLVEPGRSFRKSKNIEPKSVQGRHFVKWTNCGDACLVMGIINKINFYYQGKCKSLKLKKDSKTEKLLFSLGMSGSIHQDELKKEFCTPGRKPSEVVRAANMQLNEKIQGLGFSGIPQNIEYVSFDKSSKCYQFTLPINDEEEMKLEGLLQ